MAKEDLPSALRSETLPVAGEVHHVVMRWTDWTGTNPNSVKDVQLIVDGNIAQASSLDRLNDGATPAYDETALSSPIATE